MANFKSLDEIRKFFGDFLDLLIKQRTAQHMCFDDYVDYGSECREKFKTFNFAYKNEEKDFFGDVVPGYVKGIDQKTLLLVRLLKAYEILDKKDAQDATLKLFNKHVSFAKVEKLDFYRNHWDGYDDYVQTTEKNVPFDGYVVSNSMTDNLYKTLSHMSDKALKKIKHKDNRDAYLLSQHGVPEMVMREEVLK